MNGPALLAPGDRRVSPGHRREPVIGLALGSGAARGWAHLGVLRALAAEGVVPEVICGCSIGAFVGAAAASGDLDKLTQWAETLKWQDVVSLLDVSLRGGLIKGDKLIGFFQRNFVDREFSELDTRFACVATELTSGREVWLQEGSVSAAVRASIALPGLMTPVMHGGRLLVDGGLVNPVPVSLCRAMGADIVIAVDLGSDMVGRAFHRAAIEPTPSEETEAGWTERLLSRFGFGGGDESAVPRPASSNGEVQPSLVSVISSSLNIMQVRIARSRLAGEPADVMISPRVGQLGLMDYHRAAEALAEGEAAVMRMRPLLRYVLGHDSD
ncbi:patatin-like phospholipase RssA [Thauera linaloolentis]|uniref:Patatin n=1 Tax=Thauera linaloolentis (strain DSM 12138 / JCM 21573 / CCUG 41526 / CIP 105981 / IAM 15112 / NBRC 102519 / 47Lol) TaxID=1123367 RepID=N6Y7B8_THAL4|nr:patatin-like phospholipase RssA [Thauera linaloolentis]ENO90181.1 patatin [Thauera linaloolentis 47Lol = DSM 12138]MCM8564682.1 patatin-like phospholipase RssA [Thauera linaloolentis]